MKGLEKSGQRLFLSIEEENKIVVDIGSIIEENNKGKMSIIGKLHADRTLSKEIIQNSLLKI